MKLSNTLSIVSTVFLMGVTSPVMAGSNRVSFAGGDGSSIEKAIIVKAPNEEVGVHAEYEYIGRKFPGFVRGTQSLEAVGNRHYDSIEFKTAAGKPKKLYFDITAFFGKLGPLFGK